MCKKSSIFTRISGLKLSGPATFLFLANFVHIFGSSTLSRQQFVDFCTPLPDVVFSHDDKICVSEQSPVFAIFGRFAVKRMQFLEFDCDILELNLGEFCCFGVCKCVFWCKFVFLGFVGSKNLLIFEFVRLKRVDFLVFPFVEVENDLFFCFRICRGRKCLDFSVFMNSRAKNDVIFLF